MEMHHESDTVLLISMPYASIEIPSIQLAILEQWLKHHHITVSTYHLYLKAADHYGINNYNHLIHPPNDSYTAQMVFSKYVFPEHWKTYHPFFKKYYQDANKTNNTNPNTMTFEDYVNYTDKFFTWAKKHAHWQNHDIIGFTLNYGQFLPSLAFAKHIKDQAPEKKIVFGGSRTTGNLGKHTLQAFEYVDYIVSGDGENTLYYLATKKNTIDTIPGLIYRKNNHIHWNTTNNNIDINTNPRPSYDSFFQQLQNCLPEIQQFFTYYGRLPIEISRGCWWNRCTFCNLNLQHQHYREKHIDQIIKEIDTLSTKYKILSFQIIGNTLPKHDLQYFLKNIISLKKDFSFYAEARADRLHRKDYQLLKKAGFTTIQTGIESLSQNYLKKINKGTRVIDNIAALKYCKEHHIKNQYNLIINYPNEEPLDFKESQQTIALIKNYLDPPNICQLKVVYGSTIQQQPDHFNIQKLKPARIDKIMFPQDFLHKQFNFVFDYTQYQISQKNNWTTLLTDWQTTQQKQRTESINSPMLLDKLIFYYEDGGTFLKIYDKREPQNIQIYILNEIERHIFLLCLDIISYTELHQQLDINPSDLHNILDEFKQIGILYEEDGYYLSLPLYNTYTYDEEDSTNQLCLEKTDSLKITF